MTRHSTAFDVESLATRLTSVLRGTARHDPGTKALYSTDASNYRLVPDLVVVPADVDDLVAAVCIAAEVGAPVVVRGGGTSMAGNALGGVVIDVSRHVNRILDLDPASRTAVVEPGVVLTDLTAAAARHGLTFGADPSSASRATLGGMIANNACGAHSVAWGTTADNLMGLEALLADGSRLDLTVPAADADTRRRMAELAARPGREGELHRAMQELAQRNALAIGRRFSGLKRRISGYALDRLLPEHGYDVARFLCGTEGTLATTLRATVGLVPLPAAKALLVLGFPDSFSAAECVPHVLPHRPLTMESINDALVRRLPGQVRNDAVAAGLPEGSAWLLIEVAGDDAEQAARAGRAIVADLDGAGIPVTSALVTDPRAQGVLWRCRRDGTGLATRRADGAEAWGGWEDAAVPPDRLATYLRELDELMAAHDLSGASYGHFGEGCMHMRIDFDLMSRAGLATFRSFVEQATDLVVRLGGSVSGEHGDGRARSELLTRMYGTDIMGLFREVKQLWDPSGALNPDVIADPAPIDANIRHAGAADPKRLLTVFAYPQDAGSFAQAQRRCVGVGKCRESSGGVMCPSYQVTREEQHSTRGRAHLLWEMLRGEVITDGWRSTEVRDALDLCLSCKGCLSDCPVNVDMATYKAEFQYHHYRHRLRPLSHYSMGWLPLWSRLAGRMPRVVNRVTSSGLAGLLKRIGGIAPERAIPRFADQPLTAWFRQRSRPAGASSSSGTRGKVVLWPDSFTTYLSPEVGRAAVRVLEAAGFEVVLPRGQVCCGLTWISTGQLGVAKRVLRHSLGLLDDYLRAGVPVVGLEPSCTAVFRHEAVDLLPGDERAERAKRLTHTLAELLAAYAPDWRPPDVGGKALVQRHCHQHSVMGFEADSALMRAAGIDAEAPDSGCCGLAGNFGFERGHYEVSRAAGERVLLPAVRAADPETAIVADGFSCRTQIGQGTDRTALHLAQVLAAALDTGAAREGGPGSVGE
ncbi:FAD-binding and (Fe-S)-binding domain-containing protein [Nonomuraea sp. NPDC049269]|uniref:FAD-binding and (Fe-S)-binding domain-containing protein n=1 Tax=Nonomuraea sp. NPDC049269 TaxID=3364349 RepID=UPI0037122C13